MVRIVISVSNVASLQDCLCNCQNGKNNCLNCLNCQKCQKCQKCFLLTPYLSSCPTFQGDHLSPAMWSAVRPEAVVWLMKVERMSLSKILLRSKASSSFSELMSAIRRSAILGSFPSVCFRTTARTHMPYGHLAEKYSPQDSSLQEKHGRWEYNITTSWKISIEDVGGKVYNRHIWPPSPSPLIRQVLPEIQIFTEGHACDIQGGFFYLPLGGMFH